jgi:hypothetical protein
MGYHSKCGGGRGRVVAMVGGGRDCVVKALEPPGWVLNRGPNVKPQCTAHALMERRERSRMYTPRLVPK